MKKYIIIYTLFASHFCYSQWDSIATCSSVSPMTTGDIWTLEVFQNELYLGGEFIKVNGSSIKTICKYDGANFSAILPDTNRHGVAYVMEIYNNKLFVGGVGGDSNSIFHTGISSWNGTNWSKLNNGLVGFLELDMNALKVFNNKLYVGGEFQVADNNKIKFIATWNESKWDSVDTGVNGEVWDLEVFQNKLYISGNFNKAGGKDISNLATWDGVKWDSVPNVPQKDVIWKANSIKIINDNLILADKYIWNGLEWDTIKNISTAPTYGGYLNYSNVSYSAVNEYTCNSLQEKSCGVISYNNDYNCYELGSFNEGTISDITEFNGELYIGGFFNNNNQNSYNLAKLSSSLSITVSNTQNMEFILYPNPFNNTFTISMLPSLRLSAEQAGTESNGVRQSLNGTFSIRITDIMGKVVYSKQITCLSGRQASTAFRNDEFVIDASSLQKGIYIVEINIKNVTYRKKIIKR